MSLTKLYTGTIFKSFGTIYKIFGTIYKTDLGISSRGLANRSATDLRQTPGQTPTNSLRFVSLCSQDGVISASKRRQQFVKDCQKKLGLGSGMEFYTESHLEPHQKAMLNTREAESLNIQFASLVVTQLCFDSGGMGWYFRLLFPRSLFAKPHSNHVILRFWPRGKRLITSKFVTVSWLTLSCWLEKRQKKKWKKKTWKKHRPSQYWFGTVRNRSELYIFFWRKVVRNRSEPFWTIYKNKLQK